MHAQIEIFLSERGGGGGVVQAQRRENCLDFFMFVFEFFSPKFSGDAGGGGVPTIYGGGGVPNANFYRISKFDRTCDIPGMGVRTQYPPPPSPPPLDPHMHDN